MVGPIGFPATQENVVFITDGRRNAIRQLPRQQRAIPLTHAPGEPR